MSKWPQSAFELLHEVVAPAEGIAVLVNSTNPKSGLSAL
jgi:hypothetical protein